MSLIMDALKKVQQARSGEGAKGPFFRQPSPKRENRRRLVKIGMVTLFCLVLLMVGWKMWERPSVSPREQTTMISPPPQVPPIQGVPIEPSPDEKQIESAKETPSPAHQPSKLFVKEEIPEAIKPSTPPPPPERDVVSLPPKKTKTQRLHYVYYQ